MKSPANHNVSEEHLVQYACSTIYLIGELHVPAGQTLAPQDSEPYAAWEWGRGNESLEWRVCVNQLYLRLGSGHFTTHQC